MIILTNKQKSFLVELPLLITTYDIDIAGHVNNIVYIRWLEDLRRKLFDNCITIKKLLENNYYPVVASTSIKHKRQIKLFDQPVARMWVDGIEKKIISLKAEIMLKDKTAAIAEQKCVIYNLKDNKMEKIPDEITNKYFL